MVAVVDLRSRVGAAGRRVWRDRDVAIHVVKTGLAAGLAYGLAANLSNNPSPVFAPLAALLTVQISVYQSLSGAVRQTAGVIVGVLLAVAIADLLPTTAITIGIVAALAVALGRLLRLGQHGAAQVPVTALLLLTLGSSLGELDAATAEYRVLDTLIGASVGVLVNAVLAPPVHLRPAETAVRNLADELADVFGDIAGGVAGRWSTAEALGWLRRARAADGTVRRAERAVSQAADSLRWNPRGRKAEPRASRLREAVQALQHVSFQVRGVTRALADEAREAGAEGRSPLPLDQPYVDTINRISAALRTFGILVEGDTSLDAPLGQTLRDELAGAGAARNRATHATAPTLAPDSTTWLVHGALLADLRRTVHEIDPDRGPHRAAFHVSGGSAQDRRSVAGRATVDQQV